MFDSVLDMSRVLNMPVFWTYQGTRVLDIPVLWICQDSGYTKVLNTHETINTNSNINSFMKNAKLHRVLITTEYAWIIVEDAWLCPNVPKYVWIAIVIHLPIVIRYL